MAMGRKSNTQSRQEIPLELRAKTLDLVDPGRDLAAFVARSRDLAARKGKREDRCRHVTNSCHAVDGTSGDWWGQPGRSRAKSISANRLIKRRPENRSPAGSA